MQLKPHHAQSETQAKDFYLIFIQYLFSVTLPYEHLNT